MEAANDFQRSSLNSPTFPHTRKSQARGKGWDKTLFKSDDSEHRKGWDKTLFKSDDSERGESLVGLTP